MPDDIIEEWTRGSKLRCSFCRELYATVGCCQKLCLKTYHLPCGIKAGAVSEYSGNFDSYCPNHKNRRVRGDKYVLTDLGLVPEKVDREAGERLNKTTGSASHKHSAKSTSKSVSCVASSRVSNKFVGGDRKGSSSRSITRGRDQTQASRRTDSGSKKLTNGGGKPKRQVSRPRLLADYDTTGSSDNEASAPGSARRSRRQRKKVEPPSDIYTSAKDELEKILKSKYVSIEDTFEDLSGRRRNRRSVDSNEGGVSQKSKTKRCKQRHTQPPPSSHNQPARHSTPPPSHQGQRRQSSPKSPKNFVSVNAMFSSSDDEGGSIKDEETIANIEHFLGEMEKDYSPKSTLEERDPLMDDTKAGIAHQYYYYYHSFLKMAGSSTSMLLSELLLYINIHILS